jgi:dihydroxyacetone kinase DhaKLM complex PTS-EIIA-like component DhaM
MLNLHLFYYKHKFLIINFNMKILFLILTIFSLKINQVKSSEKKEICIPIVGSLEFNNNQLISLFDGTNWNPILFPKSIKNIKYLNKVRNKGVQTKAFGFSVAICGDYAIIGSYMDNDGKGSAYIYTKQNGVWKETQKLAPVDLEIGDFFGENVTISNDFALIGCGNAKILSNYGQGAVFLFKRNNNTWSQEAKLTAKDGRENDNFGKSVAIFNDRIIVGANSDDIDSKVDQGSAYIFSLISNSWTQEAKLIAKDGSGGNWFGCSVSIFGDYAIIGSKYSNSSKGSAYIFFKKGNAWEQRFKLVANDGVPNDDFGNCVSISGISAVVGSPNSDIKENENQGAAYVFTFLENTWTQQAKLTSSDGMSNDNFGSSVSISENLIIVGTTNDDKNNLVNAGSASIFQKNISTWTFVRQIFDSTGASNNYFGSSVAIKSSGEYLIGAWGKDSLNGSISFGKSTD